MSLLNTTVKVPPGGDPYSRCFSSYTGAVSLTAAGVSGTAKIYNVINGFQFEVATGDIGCNPPLELSAIVGDYFCIAIESADCVNVSVDEITPTTAAA